MIILFIVIVGNKQIDTVSNKLRKPAFLGTFIQIIPNVHKTWTTNQWVVLFDHLNKLGIKKLVVQWSVYNDHISFEGDQKNSIIVPGLEHVLTLADQHHMQVYLGLNYDASYWKNIEKDHKFVENYLQQLEKKNIQLANKLSVLWKTHDALSGWYLTEEVDDINWNNAERRSYLIHYIDSLTSVLHRLTPKQPVLVSGFSNAVLKPDKLADLWSAVFSKTGVDIVLFQDGVGVKKLTLEQLPTYFNAISQCAKLHNKKINIIVEIFEQTSGYPINNAVFKAVAAPSDRVKKQMQIASKYSSELFAFSIPDYMVPYAHNQAKSLYEYFVKSSLLQKK